MSHTDPGDAVTEPAQLREEIDRTREDLAETVDALAARLDVKARVRQTAQNAKQAVIESTSHAKQAAPAPVARSVDQARVVIHRAGTQLKPHRNALLLATAALAVLVGLRRRLGRSS